MKNGTDRRTRRKLIALYVFEAVIISYLVGTAIAQVIIVHSS